MRNRFCITNPADLVNLSAGDPGLRSSPGVAILNNAVPKPAGQGNPAGSPGHSATFPTPNSFAALYCEKFQCPPEKFEADLIWRCMQPRSILVARLLWSWCRFYFQPDFHLINQVKDLTGLDDVVSEISGVRHQLPVRGIFRGWLRVRISGQRLVNLAQELFTPVK